MDRDSIDREPMDHESAAPDDESVPNPNPAGAEDYTQDRVPIAEASLATGYELADVRTRPIVIFIVSLFIAAAIAHLILFYVLRVWSGQPLPFEFGILPARVSLPEVPGPGLDAAPESQLEQLYQLERERLSTYGWIDRDAGQVRIPITRAMQLIGESGLPAQDGAAPVFRLEPAFRMDSAGGVRPVGEEPSAAEQPQEGAGGTGGGSATDDIVGEEGAPPTGSEEEAPETRSNGESMTGGASSEEGIVEERDEDD